MKSLRQIPDPCCPAPWAVPADIEIVTINEVRYFKGEQVEKCRRVHAPDCNGGD